MMKKIRSLINKFRTNDKQLRLKLSELDKQSKELEWAHIYHDSIRGKKWLEELPLNVGRWAGNYSFFYVLNRILLDYKPKSILDMGLGESSKFISTYLENYLIESTHTIVEQNEEWIKDFEGKFSLSNRSNIIYCPIKEIEIKGNLSNSYEGFNEKITQKFDLYIVDGPFGSDRYSRYDIVSIIDKFDVEDEFIILFDDTNRRGERDTLNDIIHILKNKKINIFMGNYEGNKSNSVIVTQKYKFVTSL